MSPLLAAEFDYLPDHPGTVKVTVDRQNTKMYGLAAADAASFNANLERLRDLLIAPPQFNPPKGVSIDGYMRADDYVPKTKGVPVPAFAHIFSKSCFRDKKTNQPVFFQFPTDEIEVIVNNPRGGLDNYAKTDAGVEFFIEPKRTGDIAGFPLVRDDNGDEIIILSRNGEIPWVPVSREELTNYWISFWQKLADETPEDKMSPMIVNGHKDGLAKMSPEERSAPARYFQKDVYAPPVAPIGSDLGQPIVKINPKWCDPSLPRSAIQLIVCRFRYSNNINADKPAPNEWGSVSALRLYEFLHSADWKTIATALTAK